MVFVEITAFYETQSRKSQIRKMLKFQVFKISENRFGKLPFKPAITKRIEVYMMLNLNKENIPEEIKKKDHWVAFFIRDGKKIPINPKPNNEFNYVTASISDPTTWGTFEQAESMVASGFYHAVGYAMQPEDNLIFVDIDFHDEKCKSDKEREELKKKYDSLCRTVEPFNTYMEKSLSGNGVHLLAKGSLKEDLTTGSSPTMPLEIYGNKDRRFILIPNKKCKARRNIV